jgi:hypothetical protein
MKKNETKKGKYNKTYFLKKPKTDLKKKKQNRKQTKKREAYNNENKTYLKNDLTSSFKL